MRYGVHLPQFGRSVVAGGVQRAARLAEQLGFDDVWVSDHLVVPANAPYPPSYIYDPLVALAFAASVTDTIGIGTSVLVGPQYASPLALANSLASLDHMSGGRLTVGLGIGWARAEYEALHAPFDNRGKRLDEIIAVLRAAWHDDPSSHEGTYYSFSEMRILPKPAHEIPIWIGGSSDNAFKRAFELGDGYHGTNLNPDAAKDLVARVRASRPEESYTISTRIQWESDTTSVDELAEMARAFEAAGVQHLVITPDRRDLDGWLAAMESIAPVLR